MTTTTRGFVVADRTILDRLPSSAFKVLSFDNSHSPAARRELADYCKANSLLIESVPHGRLKERHRYVALVYHNSETGWKTGRTNCYATLEGWTP